MIIFVYRLKQVKEYKIGLQQNLRIINKNILVNINQIYYNIT